MIIELSSNYYSVNAYKRGTLKEYQRYEQCISPLEQYFASGLANLYAQKFYIESDQVFANKFIKEILASMIKKISRDEALENELKTQLMKKLENIQVVAGYSNQTSSDKKVYELYEELELQGDENIIYTALEIINYNMKLENEPDDSWMFNVNQLNRLNNLKYLHEKDILYIPPEYIVYPYFSQHRTRFFNTATLFTEVVLGVNEGLKIFVKKVQYF